MFTPFKRVLSKAIWESSIRPKILNERKHKILSLVTIFWRKFLFLWFIGSLPILEILFFSFSISEFYPWYAWKWRKIGMRYIVKKHVIAPFAFIRSEDLMNGILLSPMQKKAKIILKTLRYSPGTSLSA